ncbi:hypothetical protein PUR34_17620 [Streptomyces sp. JV185]|uniref:hypothetical protein n=1 Tax=Streptomyces sp. JV185 TaxID=858638 RepID=UPI002E7A9BEB|nr:hypothetical protein [Streptomyces sp. JV185]MEE1769919.1 hypothetical protein [Streptomyces sp. JV185]
MSTASSEARETYDGQARQDDEEEAQRSHGAPSLIHVTAEPHTQASLQTTPLRTRHVPDVEGSSGGL